MQKEECAFCPATANMSGEHVWSDWMNKLLPGKKLLKERWGAVEIIRKSRKLNWKANVVCEKCNNTWMSDIENRHAKPAMTPFILGETGFKITQQRADSIGLFAFKTAVVLDRLTNDRTPFFARSVRHAFRKWHGIPTTTQMWLAGFMRRGHGIAKTVYHEGRLPPSHSFELYVCTYSISHLVFQVVSIRNPPPFAFRPTDDTFKYLAIGFWPTVPSGLTWPFSEIFRTPKEIDAFADRWKSISF